MDYVEKIRQAGVGCKAGSLEAGCAALLVQLATENNQWAELIAQDLEVKEMNISSLAKNLTNYARKHKVGNGFFMDDATARKIAVDFYKLPKQAAQAETLTEKPEQKPASDWHNVDLLDIL